MITSVFLLIGLFLLTGATLYYVVSRSGWLKEFDEDEPESNEN